MKKEICDFGIKQLFLEERNCPFMKTESGLCNIVSIDNTGRAKATRIIETFDFVESMRFLENTDRICDIPILAQKLHLGCFRAEENKMMKVSSETQHRIALQKGQKEHFILDEQLLCKYLSERPKTGFSLLKSGRLIFLKICGFCHFGDFFNFAKNSYVFLRALKKIGSSGEIN